MDGSVAEIITQFAEYLRILIGYIREFLAAFKGKDNSEEGTSGSEGE